MRRLVVVLVVLVVVLVVADRVAARVAAGAVADAVRRDQRLSSTPDVGIEGFPFLTQALGGVYREVDVHLGNVTAPDGARVDQVEVRLRGVHVPPGDALHGAVSRVPVDDADARATVSFATLNAQLEQAAAAAGATGTVRLAVAPGSAPDELGVTGELPVEGATVPVRAQVRLTLARGVLTASATPASLAGVPERARARVERLLSQLSVRLPALPFGFAFTSVAVGPDGLTVAAAGRGVVLGDRPRS